MADDAYGLDIRSGLPVVTSTGTDTCSCAISQLPSTLRYTSVTRMSATRPSDLLPLTALFALLMVFFVLIRGRSLVQAPAAPNHDSKGL
jgi:hypothetical protein